VIREPQTSDLEGLVILLRKMHSETAYSAFSLSEARLRESLLGFLDPEQGYFGRVMVTNGAISGVFFGHCSQLWFSEELCGFDDLWYVGPGSRGSLLSARMVRDFAGWCREKGCSAVLVGVSSGVMMDRTGSLLETLGYGRIGGLYRRHL
jgi:hypothetical protein